MGTPLFRPTCHGVHGHPGGMRFTRHRVWQGGPQGLLRYPANVALPARGALRDGKVYRKHMVKRKPQQVWIHNSISPDPPPAVDRFYVLLNTQNWGKAETLAVEVFQGRLGVPTLPLDMTERLMIGSVFIRICGESEEVMRSYVPQRIFPSIYSVAREHRLLYERIPTPAEELPHPRDIPPHPRDFGHHDQERWEDQCPEWNREDCPEQPHVARREQRRWPEPDRWREEIRRWLCIQWHRASQSHQNCSTSREVEACPHSRPPKRKSTEDDTKSEDLEVIKLAAGEETWMEPLYDPLDKGKWRAENSPPPKKHCSATEGSVPKAQSLTDPIGEQSSTLPPSPSPPPPPPPPLLPLPLSLPPPVQDPVDPTATLSEVDAEKKLIMMANCLKKDAPTPPPYAHDLKSLEAHQYLSFVDVNDATKTLKAYITVIEAFAGRHCSLVLVLYLPRMFKNMLDMLAELPLVDTQDHPAVHHRRCVAVRHMLQNISLQIHATARSKGLQQLPKHFLGRMRHYFKDLTEADFELMCQDLLKLAPPRPKQQPQLMGPTCMDVDPPTDWAEQANSQGPEKSDNMAAEPGPPRTISPDFGLFGTLPKGWKDDTANSGSAQDCPNSTSDLSGSSTKDQVNVNYSQKPDTPSHFAPDRKTYEGYKLKRKSCLEQIPWPAPPQPCPSMMPHMLWSSTNSIQKLPSLQADVLRWTCHQAQELHVTKGPEPSWTKEVKVWVKTLAEQCRKPFSHPLMGHTIPLMFVVRFLKASFEIPRICYEEHKSFITPLIPWEYSRDVFLPNWRISMVQRLTNLTKHGPAWKLSCTPKWRCMPGSIQSWILKRRPKRHWTKG